MPLWLLEKYLIQLCGILDCVAGEYSRKIANNNTISEPTLTAVKGH